MSQGPVDEDKPELAEVIHLGRARYDANQLHLLDALEPPRPETLTIHGESVHLSKEALAELCAWLRRHKGIWSLRLLDADGRDVVMHRGQLPPCRVARAAPARRMRETLSLIPGRADNGDGGDDSTS